MLEDVLNSWQFQKLMSNIDRKELKNLKKYRDNFYDARHLFNINNFQIGDIIFVVEKFETKDHTKVTPCKILSKMKTTTRNSFNFIDVKLLNVKSKDGKENKHRLYFLDYNIDINDFNSNMCFTKKEVAEAYAEDYEPKFNRMYKIDKKRLKKSY